MKTKDSWSTYSVQFDNIAAELGDDEKAQILRMLDSLAPVDIFSNPILKNNWAKWYGLGIVEQNWQDQTGMLSLAGIGFAKYLLANGKSVNSTTGATEVKQMLEGKIEEKQVAGISPAAEALLQRMHHNWLVIGSNDYVIPATSDEDVIVQELVNRGWVYLASSGYGGTEHSYRLTNLGTQVAADSLYKSTKSALAAKLDQKIETKSVDPNGFIENNILWQAYNENGILVDPMDNSLGFISAITALANEGYLILGPRSITGKTWYYISGKGMEVIRANQAAG